MIRAGPDDPGGGPDELETRLVAVQVRTSEQGPDDPGRGPDEPVSGGSFGCLLGELAGSSGKVSGWSGLCLDRPGRRPDRPASLGLGAFPLRLHECPPLTILLASLLLHG